MHGVPTAPYCAEPAGPFMRSHMPEETVEHRENVLYNRSVNYLTHILEDITEWFVCFFS